MRAIALVGSYARGSARDDSDIDLVILTDSPAMYRADERWAEGLSWGKIGASVDRFEDRDYGALWSRTVMLTTGLEIEFGFASPEWAAVDPIDGGTRRVMLEGYRVLHDPEKLLERLDVAVRRNRPPMPPPNLS